MRTHSIAPPRDACAVRPPSRDRWGGTPIANSSGVPGTLGCLALTRHEGRLVLVTSHHVLFGAGAPARSAVWRLSAAGERRRIASAGWGRRGTVCHDGLDVHVDCAVAELLEEAGDVGDEATDVVAPGAPVSMHGGASGAREGIVADVAHEAIARADGRDRPAPGQLLVRALVRGRPFATRGDSGAVLRDARGAIVGLLWGVTAAGEGVASPIAPVLRVLHVRAVRRIPPPYDPSLAIVMR